MLSRKRETRIVSPKDVIVELRCDPYQAIASKQMVETF
jgi:hypothetical protein